MGTGQTLITVLAIVLLGTVILSTNKAIYSTSGVLLSTNYGLEATSLAMSTIEEAEYLSFDVKTADSAVNSTSSLTPASALGYEVPDDSLTPDDFDDYNGPQGKHYRLHFDTLGTGVYAESTIVRYVKFGDFSVSSTPTWLKQMDIWVYNMADQGNKIHMSAIYAYWYFR